MSTDRDVTRIVRSWLNEDRHEDAGSVLNTVLAEIETTPRRRSSWLARRFPDMNNMIRLGLAAAAVVIIAVIAINLLPGTPAPGSGPTPTPEPAAVEPTATFLPLGDRELLAAGRYRVLGAGIGPIEVSVEVPAGWSSSANWVVIGPLGNDEPDGMAIRFYTIPNLAANPLSRADGNLDPPVGPAVDDLVQAIVTHPGWTASESTDITIDGHAGQLVSITIPLDAELPADGTFYLSTDPSGGGIWGWAPGQTFDWYIVDVDGQRLIIDAFHYPDTSAEDLTAQRAVVESVQFD